MRIEQCKRTSTGGWIPALRGALADSAELVLMFGATDLLHNADLFSQVKSAFPHAHLLGCSTAGEICETVVSDDSLVVTAVEFEHTMLRGARISLREVSNSREAGEWLARALPQAAPSPTSSRQEPLKHVLVLSDGLQVNGSDLVRGLTTGLAPGVTVTGGMAGDGARFGETLVFWDSLPEKDTVAVLGLYGSRIQVGFGSLGGWDPFGPERLVTRSSGAVLYELDGQSALGLYKRYLGEHAAGLPATGLLFPLSVRTKTGETGVVRTILSIDEQAQSMTFAGDVPEGAYARLMKANLNRLIDGAIGAAQTSYAAGGRVEPQLAILISCVGRKLILRQRIEEEVEGVQEVLGARAVLAGFYSYGEISPFIPGARCELHNQTMTITTLTEG